MLKAEPTPRQLHFLQIPCWVIWVKILRYNADRLLKCQLKDFTDPSSYPPTIDLDVLTDTGDTCPIIIRFEGSELFVGRYWTMQRQEHVRIPLEKPFPSLEAALAKFTGLVIPEGEEDISPLPGYSGAS
jgi:hypothetical protein